MSAAGDEAAMCWRRPRRRASPPVFENNDVAIYVLNASAK